MNCNHKIVALSLLSVISMSAMEGNPHQEIPNESGEGANVSWTSTFNFSADLDLTGSVIGASNTVWGGVTTSLYAVTGYVGGAKRAAETRIYPSTMYGIDLPKDQSEIEKKRTGSVRHAANKDFNDCFSSDEENLSTGDVCFDVHADMLSKRLANLPATLKAIVQKPNTDATALDDIKNVRESMGNWLPVNASQILERKEKHVQKAFNTRLPANQQGE